MPEDSAHEPLTRAGGTGRDALLLLACLIVVSCSIRSEPPPIDCVFPAPPRSAIASALPSAGDSSFAGRVVSMTASPIAHALVRVDPGSHLTQTDSSGRFTFSNIPRGRYSIQVRTLGAVQATDSVTVGEHGAEIVAVLAPQQPGLYACIRLASASTR